MINFLTKKVNNEAKNFFEKPFKCEKHKNFFLHIRLKRCLK